METLQAFVVAADTEIKTREERAAKFAQFSTIAEAPAPVDAPADEAGDDEASQEAGTVAGNDGDRTADVDVSEIPGGAVVAASVAPSGTPGAKRSVQIKDVARIAPTEVIPQGDASGFGIFAAADVPGFPAGKALEWSDLGDVFEARARGYGASGSGRGRSATPARQQHGMALIERQMPAFQQILENDGEVELHTKLQKIARQAKDRSTPGPRRSVSAPPPRSTTRSATRSPRRVC